MKGKGKEKKRGSILHPRRLPVSLYLSPAEQLALVKGTGRGEGKREGKKKESLPFCPFSSSHQEGKKEPTGVLHLAAAKEKKDTPLPSRDKPRRRGPRT